MEQPITINIEKLVDKLEITNSACVNLAEIEASIQDVLLKAVNFASYEHVQNHDTNRHCNSSRSRLSEERTHRASYFRSEPSVAKAKEEIPDHKSSKGKELPFVNISNSNSSTPIKLRYVKVVDLPIKGESKEQVLAIIKDYLESQSNDMSFNLHLMGLIKSKSLSEESKLLKDIKMEPPIVNLHIQTLIGKVDIVNFPFDPNTDINGLSSKQVTQMQEKVISALLKTLRNLNKSQENSINP